MSPWPCCGRSCPSTKVIPSTPVHIWFFSWFLCTSPGLGVGAAWFCCRAKTHTDSYRFFFFFFLKAPCVWKLCALPSVYLLLPQPGTSSMFTECMKVGQRSTLYSTSLLEHISTSLLTGKPHHGGSWRARKRGTSASSQMSLAVTVPLITGSQTECGEAGHLAYCTRDSRQQWVMMQTAQLSHQQIMHTCSMYGQHQSLLHVGKFTQYLFNQRNNKLFLLKWIYETNIDVVHSRTLLKPRTGPANNPLLLPCVTEGVRERGLDMFPC